MSRSCLCPLGSSDCQEGAAQTPFAAGFLQPLSCSGSHRSSAAPSGALQMCSGFLYFPTSFSTSPFQALWSSSPSCTSSFPVHGVLAGISRELAWAQGETCGGPDCLQTLLQPRHSHRGLREGTWGPRRSPLGAPPCLHNEGLLPKRSPVLRKLWPAMDQVNKLNISGCAVQQGYLTPLAYQHKCQGLPVFRG